MTHKIHQGNNIDILKTLEDNSIDSIVTDPPYGIDFLGKDWDANTGALETYQECLRVLKPGGYILAFSAARTYHHLAITLEQAGFEIRDQLMWLYSSGFPKAQDIGKAIQKRLGVEETKPLTTNGSPNGIARMTYSQSEPKKLKETENATDIVVTSPEAKQWAGWKTALKPAHEPIAMARKPMKGSTIDNVLTHGVGALNIDATRIPYEDIKDMEGAGLNWNKTGYETGGPRFVGSGDEHTEVKKPKEKKNNINSEGRFPSNVIGEVAEEYQKYFYCPKVSKQERMLFNNHPTVKPVELMKWLVKLVTPKGGTVLDPFTGSGSTGMAAVELGHNFIGCELDPAYVDIANKRISAWTTPNNNFEELFDAT